MNPLDSRLRKLENRISPRLQYVLFLSWVRNAAGYRVGEREYRFQPGETREDLRDRILKDCGQTYRAKVLVAFGIPQ